MPERLAGLRYGDECAPTRARARARNQDSLTVDDRPKLVKIFVMAVSPPPVDKGKSVDIVLRVDSVGSVAKNGVSFSGLSDAKFAAQVRALAAKTLFRPAVLDGCAVEGFFRTTYTFGQ